MKRQDILIGFVIWLIAAVIYLPILNDYGLTWDFHFHFFSGARILGIPWQQIEPRLLPYNPPDPRENTDLPYGPLVSVIPVASYLLFYKYTGILPDDVAYNLPIALIGSLGPVILYLFLVEATKRRRLALIAALFLALTPRYFGDLHNNMKDVPMAVVFALNVWLLWRLVTYRRVRDMVLAALGFALAFNTKVNAIFIPILFATWLVTVWLVKRPRLRLRLKLASPLLFFASYFILAPLAAFGFWSLFWSDPVGKIRQMAMNFGVGTNNIEVLFAGRWYCSGYNVPWYYPWGYLGITTPLPVLLLFGLGAIILVRQFLRQKNTTSILLLLWLVVPLTRYLWPKTGVIDGIRHFEEVVFPIAATAAVGIEALFVWLTGHSSLSRQTKRLLQLGLGLLVVAYLVRAIVVYHPYQVTYFNELVGGLKGAIGKYDLDYWGTSQKKAIQWLNAHAPSNSKVTIVMAADVAARYLRPDLVQLVNGTGFDYDQADFVVLLNRQSFFYRYFYVVEYMLRRKAVFTVENQGVPLTWVFANRLGQVPRQPEWWHGDSPCIQRYWTTPPP